MNEQDRKTADRLKSALERLGVSARRTQAYDLIAAARGLRNRELLKRPHAMPDSADLEGLAVVAERIDASEAGAIVTCAAAVAVPASLLCEIHEQWRGASFEITFDELSDPDAFLAGPRGAAGIKTIARNIYHSAYYLDRSDRGLDLKRGNDLAGKMLETTEHCERYEVLEEFYGEPKQGYESLSEQKDEVDTALRALEDLANEVGADFDEDEWREPLEASIIEHIQEDDDSSIDDMIQSEDRAELLFLFSPRYAYQNDSMITAEYNSSHAAAVNIDHQLQFALSRLGYTVGEFRRFSGNVREACDDLDGSIRPTSKPLITPGQLMSIMENAGDSYYHIALYAQIPISEVRDLDTTRPMVLRNVHVCAHSTINGTHYDGPVIDEVVVQPDDGTLIAAGYSPSDICGYVNSYFHGSARNVEDPEEKTGEVVPVSFDSGQQYRLAFAA